MDKCSWEWIKPIGYHPFELERKRKPLALSCLDDDDSGPSNTWADKITALIQYSNPFRILILCYEKAQMKDIYIHVVHVLECNDVFTCDVTKKITHFCKNDNFVKFKTV